MSPHLSVSRTARKSRSSYRVGEELSQRFSDGEADVTRPSACQKGRFASFLAQRFSDGGRCHNPNWNSELSSGTTRNASRTERPMPPPQSLPVSDAEWARNASRTERPMPPVQAIGAPSQRFSDGEADVTS